MTLSDLEGRFVSGKVLIVTAALAQLPLGLLLQPRALLAGQLPLACLAAGQLRCTFPTLVNHPPMSMSASLNAIGHRFRMQPFEIILAVQYHTARVMTDMAADGRELCGRRW